MNKLILILVTTIAFSGLTACGNAGISETESIKTEKLAIRGYDAVAYFADGASKGNTQFGLVLNGVKWLFANAENLEKFKQNPEKYAPQFDGQCSWAVSHGSKAEGDPEAWKIVDGKLYLNYNADVKKRWEADRQNLIREGDKRWQELKNQKSGS